MKSLKLIDDTNNSEEFVKERHVVNYLKSMAALEEAMEPYKEQKKDFPYYRKFYLPLILSPELIQLLIPYGFEIHLQFDYCPSL